MPDLRIVIGPATPDWLSLVDAVVEEDDTWNVLSADRQPRAVSDEALAELYSHASQTEPKQPGTVVVVRDEPIRLLAIVHDLSRDPSCEPEWVADALGRALATADDLRLGVIGIPVLGARYGDVTPAAFAEILLDLLEEADLSALHTIRIMAAPSGASAIAERLRRYGPELKL